jgi:hypothetical protein
VNEPSQATPAVRLPLEYSPAIGQAEVLPWVVRLFAVGGMVMGASVLIASITQLILFRLNIIPLKGWNLIGLFLEIAKVFSAGGLLIGSIGLFGVRRWSRRAVLVACGLLILLTAIDCAALVFQIRGRWSIAIMIWTMERSKAALLPAMLTWFLTRRQLRDFFGRGAH